jgi:hypothetical protein
MSSGIDTLEEIKFKSPITGGERAVSIGAPWASGGKEGTYMYSKIIAYLGYYFDDEIPPPKVVEKVNAKGRQYAKKYGVEWEGYNPINPNIPIGKLGNVTEKLAKAKVKYAEKRKNPQLKTITDEELWRSVLMDYVGNQVLLDRFPKKP